MEEDWKDTMDRRRPLGRKQRRTVTRKRERGGTPAASRGAHGRPWPVNSESRSTTGWDGRAEGFSGIDASLREREGDLLKEERQAVRSKDGDSIINNEPYSCSKGVL